MSELIISVSGLRGIVGETLTPEVALRFITAYAEGLKDGPVVLTRDGRSSGRMLADVIRGGLCALGRNVIDADVAATPTTGVLVREHQAAGAIQISASHNPAPYNGIKLFDAAGKVINADEGAHVIERYRAEVASWRTHEHVGRVTLCEDSTTQHLQAILKNVNVEAIRGQKFCVILDSNHGAGSILGQRLLNELGCDVTQLGGAPDGIFAHTPEPTEANLREVSELARSSNASVCFCQDPDADRLAVIDENGRYIGEEYSLALCLDHVLRSTTGVVVANCATSLMSEAVAEKHGSTFMRSAVGEANVVGMMQANNAVFGGEGNGGPIDPRVGFVRDSFIGMAMILDAMAAREKPISELADELPRFEIHKTTTPLSKEQLTPALEALQRHFSDAEASRLDGLRLTWNDRWLLVRASNTEPIVRLIAEGTTIDQATELCATAAEVIASTT